MQRRFLILVLIAGLAAASCVSDSRRAANIVGPLREFDAEASAVSGTAKKLSALSETAAPTIIQLLQDENELVRLAAKEALKQMPAALAELNRAANSKELPSVVRLQCVGIIGEHSHETRQVELLGFLRSKKTPLMLGAILSLGPEDDETMFPILREIAKSADAAISAHAISAAVRIGRHKRSAFVAEFIKDSRKRVRVSVINSLASLDRKRYAHTIALGLIDEENYIVDASISALLWRETREGARDFVARVAALEPSQAARVIDRLPAWKDITVATLVTNLRRSDESVIRDAIARLSQRVEARARDLRSLTNANP